MWPAGDLVDMKKPRFKFLIQIRPVHSGPLGSFLAHLDPSFSPASTPEQSTVPLQKAGGLLQNHLDNTDILQ